MAEFLSDAWVAELDRRLNASPELAEAATGADLVIGQTVETSVGPFSWKVVFDDGRCSATTANEPAASVTFHQDEATAVSIARGETSAQAAFIAGHVRLTGEAGALLSHQHLVSSLAAVVADMGETTTFRDHRRTGDDA